MKNKAFSLLFGPLLSLSVYPLFGQATRLSEDVSGSGYLLSITDRSVRFDTTSLKEEIVTIEPAIVDESALWKEWRLVDNFSFGKDRGSLPMIADLKALHPYFRDKIVRLISLCEKKGIELVVVESYRTKAKQAEYFGMGKKYTRSKGGKSKHQYGLAVDLVPIVNGEAQWDDKVLWKKIGTVGESLGLRWGGRWRSPYDPAHFEWTGGVSTAQLAGGTAVYVPNSGNYPCVEEDLGLLKKYWNAWETEQSQLANDADVNRVMVKR